jgi:hypothetical protein
MQLVAENGSAIASHQQGPCRRKGALSHKAEGSRVKIHQEGFLLSRCVATTGDRHDCFVNLASLPFAL